MNELILKISEIIFEINKEMVHIIVIIIVLTILYIKALVYKKKGLAVVKDMVDADLGGVILGGFFKKPEYCCCYSSTYLTCDQDDVKNFHHLKFSGFNLESMSKVGINNLLSKNLQLHLYDYNRFILEIVVENMTATGATPLIIIILACVIAIITIPLILYMVPW
jgi:hypothetical protein